MKVADGVRAGIIVAVTVFVPMGVMIAGETSLPPFAHLDVLARIAMAIPLALLVAALDALLLWPVVRNDSARALAAIYILIYAPVVAFLLVGLANVALDRSPITEHDARVVRYEHPHKGSGAMVVTSWRSPGDVESLPILVTESSSPPGSIVRVLTHPGALGLTWVTDVKPR